MMTANSSAGAPQFRVGPETDPDRYALGTAVSSGAEGILYRGWITTAAGVTLDVAIKMLQPRFLSHVEDWHIQWAEQVELLRSLQVPGIVPVRDGFLGPLPHAPGQAGEGETLYLVMNWVEGETLDDWARHRPDRNPIDDLKVLVPVAAALDLMHSGRATGGVPVVHRDIKPANVLVTEHGSVLVDFGLTRGLPDGQRMTGVVGTPGYLAPESVGAGNYSAASDRYAFGGLAYFLLTGFEPPIDHQPEAMRTSLTNLSELAEHPEVSDQVMAMLATDPDERPPGLANWIGQLRRSSIEVGPDILNPPAPSRHPPGTPKRRADRRLVAGRSSNGSRDCSKSTAERRSPHRWIKPTAVALAIVALVVGSTLLAQALLNRPTVIYVLPPGATLNANASVSSPNHSYGLTMQSNGDLVIRYRPTGKVIFSTDTSGNNYYAAMQANGYLVVCPCKGTSNKWASTTSPGPGAHLKVLNNGVAVLQSNERRVTLNSQP